jgi:glycosyltransferase involved in cell wall biosynthesis
MSFSKKKPFVVIPAYNEEKTVFEVIKKTKKYAANIVVVDDGSKDKTFEEAEKAGAAVLRHAVNLGKGAAMKTGCEYAIKKGAKTIIILDADGQHDPAEIPKLTQLLDNADIVFAYRKIDYHRMPVIKKAGNWFINTSIALLFGIRIRDTQCGYRAFTRGAYQKIRWIASDYSVETEIVARTGKNKLRFRQTPIKTIYSDAYRGVTVFDGIKIFLSMLWLKIAK